jgi:hypothetical protein
MLKRRWSKEHRGLAIFDLSTGLLIPFVIATGCLVIAAATQFHGNADNYKYTNSATLKDDLASQISVADYEALAGNEEKNIAGDAAAFEEKLQAHYVAQKPEPKALARLEMLTAKRSQFELAKALEPFVGSFFSQYVFGIGVLAMAVSTIIILMLINGFAVCEMLGLPDEGKPHRIGCLIAGVIGVFGPVAWGDLGPWLAIPVSVFGLILLPIAYLAFLLLMNSKTLLGDSRPEGGRRVRWNILMIIATAVATLGAAWASHGKIGWYGPGLIVAFGFVVAVTHRGERAGKDA